MSFKPFALAPLFAAVIALPAFAQPSPTMLRQFGDWNVYSYQAGASKSCYVLTIPKQATPASVNHGDNFFLVAPKPSGSGYYPQAIMGYDLQNSSQITVTIDGKSFAMTPRGNSGWTQQESNDSAMIDAMRTGSNMTLQAVSGRGTRTSYTFSLSGVTAALNQAGQCN
ncbi:MULTISPECIES: invasion associated locus B family protein [Rhizobium/Agrobacterium group]|jgi:hypothetical protein|uniref:Uncharacterized protein n=1 Tax=Rhizobium soli TaxID=424798 RepID=A0A7X0MU67_9HYPH|nr:MULTISPECIES: invasion associated locus B family protein [Rhizobium/Agrobacterium group]RYE64968.1 MAG: hypothetical protein EOP17_14935 [Rhizobiaceae bacterium]KQQ79334.1 hypothetical protein ASF70_01185 [Rhizobium sp. Leaf321]MBB6509990.1 hypothetical protein [Rhizobium soli]MBD8653446.1 invasion associated locus B family protein [Rhizobium sp. CFBP 13726]MBD8665389.1 invasion associated locus B family protein [Rhizobium sp. CFBP 8752]